MFYLDFWYFFFYFSHEIKLYMKSAREVRMTLKTFFWKVATSVIISYRVVIGLSRENRSWKQVKLLGNVVYTVV